MGISLGPWRSISIFDLNMLFAIAIRISVSALSSQMNRQLVWQKARRIKHDLPTYNASINLRTKCSERKRRRGQNKKKKSASLWFTLRNYLTFASFPTPIVSRFQLPLKEHLASYDYRTKIILTETLTIPTSFNIFTTLHGRLQYVLYCSSGRILKTRVGQYSFLKTFWRLKTFQKGSLSQPWLYNR